MRLLTLLLVVAVLPLPAAAAPKVLVLGDSLSAAYGIALEAGWVHLFQERIRSRGLPHQVINASVSGETTSGGLERLPDLLDKHEPELVLIALGGNDGLRGLPIPRMEENLRAMLDSVQAAGAEAALFEMRIPSNYGATYTQRFRAAFSQVAEAEGAVLVPFLLADIAGDPSAFLDDGIHPSAQTQPVILKAVWPHLLPMLGASKSGSDRN
ncbi:arylesterase [Algiphilus aromaticivorans]|uniref:arylesterase n=1 Tax=Algiphilus aromaticivorans TaxID=382454 RepID=UPI001E4D64BE|nr:arylesterase [Algiphilus aromaticivorans]